MAEPCAQRVEQQRVHQRVRSAPPRHAEHGDGAVRAEQPRDRRGHHTG